MLLQKDLKGHGIVRAYPEVEVQKKSLPETGRKRLSDKFRLLTGSQS